MRTAQAPESLVGLAVLIVDDNATNLRILEKSVRGWGMRPECVSSGDEALVLINERNGADSFALALLDMQMPGMDGVALAKRIQAEAASPLTMILLTSLSELGICRSMRKKLFADCLTKPIAKKQLLDCMLSALAQGAEPAPATVQPQPAARQFPMPERVIGKPIRVLVAEDNAINQRVALLQLQRLGFRADAVANGLEVLDALARVPYDIVLMDCQMPEMDGYEATRRLREREQSTQHTTVIAMTASARAEDRERCLQAGMDDYISKPVQFSDLAASSWPLGSAADHLRRFARGIRASLDHAIDIFRADVKMRRKPNPTLARRGDDAASASNHAPLCGCRCPASEWR